MSTRSLRDILRQGRERELGFRLLLAEDAHGPGGAVFIAAGTELEERHLAWLERRNPAVGAPTYVEVFFARQQGGAPPLPTGEGPAASRRRAGELAAQVGRRGEEVVEGTTQLHRLLGDRLFASGAAKNPRVRAQLEQLAERLRHFHGAVRAALDEYVEGNALIVDLIAQFDPGVRAVTHGLEVAVLAIETAAPVLAEENAGDGGALKRALAEIFVGGFLHDCGLWGGRAPEERGHEASGARLIYAVPALRELAPALVSIALFHSDALRLGRRGALVRCLHHPGDPDRLHFSGEFYARRGDAERSALAREAGAEVLSEADRAKIIPVALAEYCATQTGGFHAHTLPEAISRLAREAEEALYCRFLTALCNTQVEPIAPRRAYVGLRGRMPSWAAGIHLEVDGYGGGSLLHGNDPDSPHLVLLAARGGEQKPHYVDPRSPDFWARRTAPPQRLYLPAGRYKSAVTLTVTGFMSEAAFAGILGEYEAALRAQAQA